MRIQIHSGDFQGSRLRDALLFPRINNTGHLQSVLDGGQVGQLCLVHLQGLCYPVPGAARQLLSCFLSPDVRFRQSVCFLRQNPVWLYPLPVCLDHSRQLLVLRHGRQDPAQDLAPPRVLRRLHLQQVHRLDAAVSGDQAELIAVPHHGGRLQNAVCIDGLRQILQRLRVRLGVKILRIQVDVSQSDPRRIRIGHGLDGGCKLGNVKILSRHAHTSSISSPANIR